jgi:hypothetical protein
VLEEMARITDLEETLFTDGDYGRLYDSKQGNHTGAMDREDAEKVKIQGQERDGLTSALNFLAEVAKPWEMTRYSIVMLNKELVARTRQHTVCEKREGLQLEA